MIGKNLKMLREAKNKSQQEVCNDLNIEQSTLANYENDKRVPKIDILIKIAKYYKVSVDYLLGLKKSNSESNNCYDYFYEEGSANWDIRKIADEADLSYEELIEKTCISKERFDLLWFGNVQPVADELIRFSKVLNVSIDYILDNSQRKRINIEENIVLQYYEKYPSEVLPLLESFCSLDRKERTIILGKCLEYERELSVAAESPMKEAK